MSAHTGDHWVLVTGANRGLGLLLAKKLAEDGRKVLVGCRRKEDAQATVKQSVGAHTTCVGVEVDTSSLDSVQRLVDLIKTHYCNDIGVLVNNAGMLRDDWAKVTYDLTMATNAIGPMTLTESLLPYMAEGGRIVNVSSNMGKLDTLSHNYKGQIESAQTLSELFTIPFDENDTVMAQASAPTYRISKAIMNGATVLLANSKTAKDRNITITAVSPGWCRTDMGGDDAPRSAEIGRDSVLWNVYHPRAADINGGFFMDGQLTPF